MVDKKLIKLRNLEGRTAMRAMDAKYELIFYRHDVVYYQRLYVWTALYIDIQGV